MSTRGEHLVHADRRFVTGGGLLARLTAPAFAKVLDQIDRRLAVTGLVRDHTKKMQAVGVVGIDLEDLPVKSLGLVEPARLV